MIKSFIWLLAPLALTACAGVSNAPTTTAQGLSSNSKISVLFQDFPDGTICTVTTPVETLRTTAMPGKIDYPAAVPSSPVSCEAPNGDIYDVDIPSVLPQSFRVAGITAYGTGLIVSTVSAGQLLQLENQTGVAKRR